LFYFLLEEASVQQAEKTFISEIQHILTPEQWQQFVAAHQREHSLEKALENLSFSAEQRQQLQQFVWKMLSQRQRPFS
jgi:Spy/CpxP family protein refolding chaperone